MPDHVFRKVMHAVRTSARPSASWVVRNQINCLNTALFEGDPGFAARQNYSLGILRHGPGVPGSPFLLTPRTQKVSQLVPGALGVTVGATVQKCATVGVAS